MYIVTETILNVEEDEILKENENTNLQKNEPEKTAEANTEERR